MNRSPHLPAAGWRASMQFQVAFSKSGD